MSRSSLFLALLLGCAALACQPAAAPGGGQGAPPDFELATLDGRSERLSDHLAKEVVLIDFWATYCEPCLAAMPHLDALYRAHQKEGFVVLGISIDGADSLAAVRREVQKLGISFPILLDSETRVVALYNPKTTAPYSVLIDRHSRITQKFEGYTAGSTTLDDAITAALATKIQD